MVVVRQVSRALCDVRSEQVDVQVIRKMCSIDDRNNDRTVLVDVCAHIHFLDGALSLNADGSGASKAEVACESPQAARNEVLIVLEADECVVSRSILATPKIILYKSARFPNGRRRVYLKEWSNWSRPE